MNFLNLFPNCSNPGTWQSLFEEHFPLHGITDHEQIAMFLAQTGHESSGFTVFEENLNYSGDRLAVIFPKYFKNKNPNEYSRKPIQIANLVYSNRMGNGSEESGDGYKFRGRGLIQLTGKDNYRNCSVDLFSDFRFINDPDLIKQPQNSLLSALWFWDKHQLNTVYDITKSTKVINGGLNGLDHRVKLYNEILHDLINQS